MKFVLLLASVSIICVCYALPIDDKQNNKEAKSAFGPVFDEIVVESSLTVRRKNDATGRQAKSNQNITSNSDGTQSNKKLIKRQLHIKNKNNHNRNFGGSAANAQAQSFDSFGPLGQFGASATGAQTQSFQGADGQGLMASAGFSGTQQYRFNGQTVDIAFGNSFAGGNNNNAQASGAVVTFTGRDGQKRPFPSS